MKREIVLVLAFACGLPVTGLAVEPARAISPPAADVKQELLKLGNEWVAAEIRHDAATLDRILDDKFVASFGSGMPYTKAAFIKANSTGEVDPTESQTLSDETVVVDGDTAIVVGTDTLRRTKGGATITMVARYTATYVYRHGRWRALAEHMVKVPEAE